ncbi:MAG: hypothetical protein HY563_10405 [Ignavibacteriales bacterium]|nr:hypothetical protein [Ignavibacteriales bacterium]
MNRISRNTTVVLVVFFFLGFPNHVEGQEKKDEQGAHLQQEKDYYTCPMHAEVKSDEPGKCLECGMSLVQANKTKRPEEQKQGESASLSGKDKALKAKQLLAEAKEELYYNCCMKNPCDRCALDHQSCSCYSDLQKGEGICSDCYAGWQMGEGKDIKGITKKHVKPNFHRHKH